MRSTLTLEQRHWERAPTCGDKGLSHSRETELTPRQADAIFHPSKSVSA